MATAPGDEMDPQASVSGQRRSPYDVKIVHQEDLVTGKGVLPGLPISLDTEAELVCQEYTLNYEQVRAYRMMTHQLIHRPPNALLMYLGGVGGTGKSRVLNACMEFLNRVKQSHRFAVTAPTGSAACLIDGTTYQSFLGIGQEGTVDNVSEALLAKIRSRLVHVDILFIDEVSMISCTGLYNISAQMCKALNVPDVPFGGKSVVFAGDFAQLPPPGPSSHALYSDSVPLIHASSSRCAQTASIGKAVWHLVTKAVILCQNMRMSSMTERDRKFTAALENMRYADCTHDDIELLMSRVQGPDPERPKLSDPCFRNVSIITAFNAERDEINDIGAQRFASETGQILHTFCSVDTTTSAPERDSLRATQKASRLSSAAAHLTDAAQERLWSLPPSVSDQHAGKLSLCLDMPILLKHNKATELCATNGAEGRVYGWTASALPNGNQALETVFVQLTNPPRTTILDNLPPNVIPLGRTKKRIRCQMRSDKSVYINREQVAILPNFAMSDFCSQGRTRPYNVVDLVNCRNHQSVYTCLSRSSSLDGTLIVQPFSANSITKGMAPGLRQEMREWEIIDQVCEWQQNGDLEPDFPCSTRAALVEEFYRRWGTKFVPPRVHPSLRWDNEVISAPARGEKWHIISKGKKRKGGSNVPDTTKRTRLETEKGTAAAHPSIERPSPPSTSLQLRELAPVAPDRSPCRLPIAITWDRTNWSCAYDSFLIVLWSSCLQYPFLPIQLRTRYGQVAQSAGAILESIRTQSHTPDAGRDHFRDVVSATSPNLFPRYGQREASVADLAANTFVTDEIIGINQTRCPSCGEVYRHRQAS